MPITNYRSAATARLLSKLEAQLWSSSATSTSSPASRYIGIYSNLLHVSLNTYRGYGHSVRCFSNDYMFTSPSMTIHPNG